MCCISSKNIHQTKSTWSCSSMNFCFSFCCATWRQKRAMFFCAQRGILFDFSTGQMPWAPELQNPAKSILKVF